MNVYLNSPEFQSSAMKAFETALQRSVRSDCENSNLLKKYLYLIQAMFSRHSSQ